MLFKNSTSYGEVPSLKNFLKASSWIPPITLVCGNVEGQLMGGKDAGTSEIIVRCLCKNCDKRVKAMPLFKPYAESWARLMNLESFFEHGDGRAIPDWFSDQARQSLLWDCVHVKYSTGLEVSLRQHLNSILHIAGGCSLLGRKVWVYWYEQRSCEYEEDHALDTVRQFGHSAKAHMTGLWYQAQVIGVDTSNSLIKLSYTEDGMEDIVGLGLNFLNWDDVPTLVSKYPYMAHTSVKILPDPVASWVGNHEVLSLYLQYQCYGQRCWNKDLEIKNRFHKSIQRSASSEVHSVLNSHTLTNKRSPGYTSPEACDDDVIPFTHQSSCLKGHGYQPGVTLSTLCDGSERTVSVQSSPHRKFTSLRGLTASLPQAPSPTLMCPVAYCASFSLQTEKECIAGEDVSTVEDCPLAQGPFQSESYQGKTNEVSREVAGQQLTEDVVVDPRQQLTEDVVVDPRQQLTEDVVVDPRQQLTEDVVVDPRQQLTEASLAGQINDLISMEAGEDDIICVLGTYPEQQLLQGGDDSLDPLSNSHLLGMLQTTIEAKGQLTPSQSCWEDKGPPSSIMTAELVIKPLPISSTPALSAQYAPPVRCQPHSCTLPPDCQARKVVPHASPALLPEVGFQLGGPSGMVAGTQSVLIGSTISHPARNDTPSRYEVSEEVLLQIHTSLIQEVGGSSRALHESMTRNLVPTSAGHPQAANIASAMKRTDSDEICITSSHNISQRPSFEAVFPVSDSGSKLLMEGDRGVSTSCLDKGLCVWSCRATTIMPKCSQGLLLLTQPQEENDGWWHH
ncbi:hypothetical protein CEUSTIGMA_g11268.t1 [Chlamydomonas eustigma]|uniref:Uncharacterized protein n=1 Tax=Chlamydomonas eustigma TaxID=1157962 RepID=A0A250XL93_9CHLO|nr:hypothetical protein CEUSTIGMA_g11268.t1 [Chlamydomonas eustigma]|eukprot:GAX83844.1 hypothetical protein CEUSTIGMA_g11268.t1 [Chlamydomonas eustigma]